MYNQKFVEIFPNFTQNLDKFFLKFQQVLRLIYTKFLQEFLKFFTKKTTSKIFLSFFLEMSMNFLIQNFLQNIQALANAKVPVYLCNIIWDYFQDRMVIVQTALSMVEKEITGVSPWTPTMEFCLRRHYEGGNPTGSKRHLLRR